MTGSWKEGELDYLRKWWGTLSATKIGETLSRTRNSVIGKAHRLGLPDLGNPIGTGSALHKKQRGERQPYKRRDENGDLKVTHKAKITGGFFSTQTRQISAANRIAVSTGNRARAEQRRETAGRPPQQPTGLQPVLVRHGDPVRNGIRSGQAAAERRLSHDAVPRRSIRLHEPKQTEPIADDGRRGVAFADLSTTGCKWAVTPHTVPSDQHRFCNAPRLPERPYCGEHCDKARGVARVATDEALEHLAGVDQAGKAA